MKEISDERVREAEQQVLGALLTGKDSVLLDVFDEIDPADLWRPADAEIADCIRRMSDRGEPVSPVTVGERLGAELRRVGGLSYLLELHGKAPITETAAYLAREIIRPASRLRQVTEVGHRLAALGESKLGEVDVDDVVGEAARLLDVASARQRLVQTTAEQDVWEAMGALETTTSTATPWRELTLTIGGWQPGCLYLVGARPAVGKSVVATNILLDVARRGMWAHLASVEMSKTEVYHRLLCDIASVNHELLVHRTLRKEHWSALGTAAKHIAGLPISVDENPSQRVADIRARCRALARRGTLGIVIVDYLQIMQGTERRGENRERIVAGISRSLKIMAKELHVPVVALSQLNRGPEQRADRMPQVSDLRESGGLEQDADGVLLLHRDEEEPGIMQMLVGKNRHGPAGKLLRLSWRGEFSRVEDYVAQPAVGSYYEEPA